MTRPGLDWHRHHVDPPLPYPWKAVAFGVAYAAFILGLCYVMLVI